MGSTFNKQQHILHKSKSEDLSRNQDQSKVLVRTSTFNKEKKQLEIDAISKKSIQESIMGDDFPAPIQQKEVPKEMLTYDLNRDLQFEAKALNSKIKASMTNTTTIPAMISLKAKDLLVEQDQRTGLDLVCIIDKSGSMYGEKIKMVKKTLLTLLNFLSEKDRFSVILFDHNTHLLFELKQVTQENKQFYKEKIELIDAGGNTDISRGLIQGLELLKTRQFINQVTSIFLLSDGQDPSSRRKLNEIFKNISFPFTLHTFGYGNDHDANIMTQISKIGNGNFYFVQNLSLLDEFFVDALGSLITVIGQQVKIDINCNPQPPFDKIFISKTFGSMWEQKVSQKQYQINLPVIASGQSKDFVFELEIPNFENNIGNQEEIVTIVNFNLQLQCPKTKQNIEKTCQLNLIFCNDEQQLLNMEKDLDVAAQYYRVKGTDIIEQARLACENQKYEEGKKLIQDIILEIESDEKIKNLCTRILEDLRQALQACDREQYRNYGQAMMMQQVSNNYQQSGLSSQFNQHGHQFSSDIYYSNILTHNLISTVQNSKSTKCSSDHNLG